MSADMDDSGRHSLDWQTYDFAKRLRGLEDLVPRLDERSKQTHATLEELVKELRPLRDALNRGKGGLAVVVFFTGLISSAVTGILVHLVDAFARGVHGP